MEDMVLGLRDTLDRFRRAGTPGPAARAGVPVDRDAERASELEWVLARLADTQAECRQIRSAGAQAAAAVRRRARERAASIVADARNRADAVRADAAARARAASEGESARLITEAEGRASAICAGAEQRMSNYVERVVALVLESTESAGADTTPLER